jgi:hypothetical protein
LRAADALNGFPASSDSRVLDLAGGVGAVGEVRARRRFPLHCGVRVADSPDRQTARALPTLGGVEPLMKDSLVVAATATRCWLHGLVHNGQQLLVQRVQVDLARRRK